MPALCGAALAFRNHFYYVGMELCRDCLRPIEAGEHRSDPSHRSIAYGGAKLPFLGSVTPPESSMVTVHKLIRLLHLHDALLKAQPSHVALLISAREATARERRDYEENKDKRAT